MSERTEPVRHEYTEEGGQRIRTTSITDKPADDPRFAHEKRPGRPFDALSYPHPEDED